MPKYEGIIQFSPESLEQLCLETTPAAPASSVLIFRFSPAVSYILRSGIFILSVTQLETSGKGFQRCSRLGQALQEPDQPLAHCKNEYFITLAVQGDIKHRASKQRGLAADR